MSFVFAVVVFVQALYVLLLVNYFCMHIRFTAMLGYQATERELGGNHATTLYTLCQVVVIAVHAWSICSCSMCLPLVKVDILNKSLH